MDKTLLLASLISAFLLLPLLFYLTKKVSLSVHQSNIDSQPNIPSSTDQKILSQLLDFSAATWFVFNGILLKEAAPNSLFFLKAKQPVLTLEDLKKFIKPEFKKSFSYFFKNLITKNHPFYLQVTSSHGHPLEIKAFSYKSTNGKNLYFVFMRKLSIAPTIHNTKQNLSNFEIIKQLTSNIALPCWIKKQDGKILHVNKAYEEISKMKNYQIIEQNLDIVDHETEAAYAMQNARNNKNTYRKKTYSVLGGVNYYLDILEKPLKTGIPLSENLYLGVAVDCSKESNIKDKLAKYKKSFYELLKDFSIGIAIFNEKTQLVFYNDVYAKLLSLGDDEKWLKSQPTMDKLLDILHQHQRLPYQPDYSKFKKERLDLFKNLQKIQEEILYLPDGSVIRITISPYSTGGLFYTMESITDTLQLSEKYNTLIDVLKTTVDNLYEGVAVIGEDGTFTLCNETFHKFWKIRKNANLKGRSFIETLENFRENFLSLQDWREHKEDLISCLSSRSKTKNLLKDKDNISVVFTYTPLPNGSHLFSYLKNPERKSVKSLI